MKAVIPMGQGLIANDVAISMNPLRIAQFSYKLVTASITDIIPLAVRATRNSKDIEAVREILYIFNNQLYESRDAYYSSITLGMLQGCNGLSLILGYTNPWAQLLRKQCEAFPVMMQGLYDLVLSMLVDVPFAKCICVDERGNNFVKYAMDNCYYFAPKHMKPVMLSLIENAQVSKNVEAACSIMVDYAKSGIINSMQPWFSVQFQATDAMASSIDYILSFITSGSGKCMDFATNPYATVLIPEPMDYFASCAATSVCDAKCAVDFEAFERQKLIEIATLNEPVSKQVEKTTESMLFVDLDEDAYTPMNILAMVELSDCRLVYYGYQ